jgi:hypothetical protein
LVAARPQALRIKEVDLFGRPVLLVTKTKGRRKPAPASAPQHRPLAAATSSRSSGLRRAFIRNPATSAVARWARSRRA